MTLLAVVRVPAEGQIFGDQNALLDGFRVVAGVENRLRTHHTFEFVESSTRLNSRLLSDPRALNHLNLQNTLRGRLGLSVPRLSIL